MFGKLRRLAILGLDLLQGASVARATQIEVYGAWHRGNDFCTWGTVREMTNFDTNNRWMIDRGTARPSVNLVILRRGN